MIYNQKDGTFTQKKGPIFANLILADEINRAPAKVQSALLEAMQEHQVTIGDQTYPLPEPFMVMATQNPIEQEGTYPLPEAQVDRFMLKVLIGYPDARGGAADPGPDGGGRAARAAAGARRRRTSARARQVGRVDLHGRQDQELHREPGDGDARAAEPTACRSSRYLQFGASPRATIYLAKAARAHAFLCRRGARHPRRRQD